MKDYYDIYFFLTKLKYEINLDILKDAIKNTFTQREAFYYLKDYEQILELFIHDSSIKHPSFYT